jgi:hypothetical protein
MSSLSRVTGYRRSHRREETTPNYSLNYARSGSGTYKSLNLATGGSISPLRATPIVHLTRSNFREISRAQTLIDRLGK